MLQGPASAPETNALCSNLPRQINFTVTMNSWENLAPVYAQISLRNGPELAPKQIFVGYAFISDPGVARDKGTFDCVDSRVDTQPRGFKDSQGKGHYMGQDFSY